MEITYWQVKHMAIIKVSLAVGNIKLFYTFQFTYRTGSLIPNKYIQARLPKDPVAHAHVISDLTTLLSESLTSLQVGL